VIAFEGIDGLRPPWPRAAARKTVIAQVRCEPQYVLKMRTPDRRTMKDVKDSREARLKLALRENLKRRKSQARGRSEEAAPSSETADVSLDDSGGAEPRR
jgi:hypothetical protein